MKKEQSKHKMKIFLITVIFTFLSAVTSWANNTTAINQPITSIVVKKSDRKMYLFSGEKVLRRYRIGLGFSPKGDKKFEGDGKTPEGKYYIDRKNPNSQYYLSLGISYPNESDKKEAAKLGKLPGGDIFIHGRDKSPKWWKRDWTFGCIAIRNHEMDEIYSVVDIGTPIFILP